MQHKIHKNVTFSFQIYTLLLFIIGLVPLSYSQNLDEALYNLNQAIFSQLNNLPTRGQRLRVAIANFHNKETGKGCRPLTRFLAKDFGQYFRDTNVRENRFEVVPYQSLRFIEHKCNIANDNFLCTDSELATLADIFITGSWDNRR
ncbi:hypothetical protein TI05_06480 [Achromatium sp. WMS3]|nr:hypothetical protein TI05_06480 [Achromatium sp. WMS3]